MDGIQSLGVNGHAFGELGAAVSGRTLTHAICSLMTTPTDDSEPVISKSDLRHLRDRDYAWPDDVSADTISPFPKNIAKNFMRGFFQRAGYALSVVHQFSFSFRFCLCLLLLCILYLSIHCFFLHSNEVKALELVHPVLHLQILRLLLRKEPLPLPPLLLLQRLLPI